MLHSQRVRLGELLVKSGLVSQQQLDETLSLQRSDGRRLGTLLVETGLVSETQVTQILSQQLSVPWVSLLHIDFHKELLDLVPREVVAAYCLVPIYIRRVRSLGDTLYVAMDDPTDSAALAEVAQYSGLNVRPMIAPPSDIRRAVKLHYGILHPETESEEATQAEEVSEVSAGAGSEAPAASGDTTPSEVPPQVESPSGPEQESKESEAPATAVPVKETQAGDAAAPGRPPLNRPGVLSLTLLDGTTIRLPSKGGRARAARSQPQNEEQLTTRDLVSALRAMSQGGDATDIVGKDVRWEALFAALLSLLLRKHLIADWEFLEEYEKTQSR